MLVILISSDNLCLHRKIKENINGRVIFVMVVVERWAPFYRIFDRQNVRAEKRGSKNWSEKRWFSFQKIDLHFDYRNPGPNRPSFKDIRGRNILSVKHAIKWGSTFNHHTQKMALPLMFSFFFLCKHKSSDELEMTSIAVECCYDASRSFFLK